LNIVIEPTDTFVCSPKDTTLYIVRDGKWNYPLADLTGTWFGGVVLDFPRVETSKAIQILELLGHTVEVREKSRTMKIGQFGVSPKNGVGALSCTGTYAECLEFVWLLKKTLLDVEFEIVKLEMV
jgi:hypothetical protein